MTDASAVRPHQVPRRAFLAGLAASGAALGSRSKLDLGRSGFGRNGIRLDGVIGAARLRSMAAMAESPVVGPGPALSVMAPSVELGTPIVVRASSDRVETLDLAISRVGWYDGRGASTVWRGQAKVDRTHRAVLDVRTNTGFSDGVHVLVARSVERSTSPTTHPFVVTNSQSDAPTVVQIATLTYQAYNGWGGASLYDYNSPEGAAASVALDRPYDIFDGLGCLPLGDLQLVQWLERQRIPVTYATNLDTHQNPNLMRGRKLFLTNFHDEYWSAAMRNNLERWVVDGTHSAFLSANSIYWQVELDLAGDTPTMHCAKDPLVPTQYLFRSSQVGRPEAAFLGAAYDSFAHPYGTAFDWVVENSDHWLYDRTGLRNGDRIKRLVGYEWDRLDPGHGISGLTVLAGAAVRNGRRHNATIIEQPGRGTVLNVGTTYWSRLLSGGGHWPDRPHRAVEQMTSNLFSQLT